MRVFTINLVSDSARDLGNQDWTIVFPFISSYALFLVKVERKYYEKEGERKTASRHGQSLQRATLLRKRLSKIWAFLPSNPTTEFPLVKIHLGRRWSFKDNVFEFTDLVLEEETHKETGETPSCLSQVDWMFLYPTCWHLRWKEVSLAPYKILESALGQPKLPRRHLSQPSPHISVWQYDINPTDVCARPINVALLFFFLINTGVVQKDLLSFWLFSLLKPHGTKD